MPLAECRPLLLAPERMVPDVRHVVVIEERLRLDAHVLDQDIALERAFGDDALAARVHDVDLRRLLVGGQVGFQVEVLDAIVVVQDPTAGSKGGAADHVLPGGVAGGVVEAQVGELAGQVGIDVLELGHAGGGFGLFGDLGEVGPHPLDEVARLGGIVKDEDRRALHRVADHRALDAAREVEHLHAAVVGGDQRAFGGGHRHDELALRVLAVDGQRAGKADRHLRDAGEVLDVALEDLRSKE